MRNGESNIRFDGGTGTDMKPQAGKEMDAVAMENFKQQQKLEREKAKTMKMQEIQAKQQRKDIFERELASRFKDQMEEYEVKLDMAKQLTAPGGKKAAAGNFLG